MGKTMFKTMLFLLKMVFCFQMTHKPIIWIDIYMT